MKTDPFRLRGYQDKLATDGLLILRKHGILYLALEMRVGKTHISLEIAKRMGVRSVLFVTKKMAIGSIKKDLAAAGHGFRCDVINYESVHKTPGPYDLVIADEAHALGAFPRPSTRAKKLREVVRGAPLILLSGTPTPESYAQLYHQLWVSKHSPFAEWDSFYKWARAGFVYPKVMRVSGYTITDYSEADKKRIDEYTKRLFLSFTQAEAEFTVTELQDEIITIEADERIGQLVDIVTKHRFYRFLNDDELVCDSAVKLQSKVHQICSGTVITEQGLRILDRSKAEYIKKSYKGKKIAIFYLYVGEGQVLEETFGKRITRSPEEFQASPDKIFIGQFQSSSRGINLSSADVLIFYNIHFSSELYQQARQRAQEKNKVVRTKIHWLFTRGGIERKVYAAVQDKQDYTLSYFMKDYQL